MGLLESGPLIEARLKAQCPTAGDNVFSTEDLAGVKEKGQVTPALHIVLHSYQPLSYDEGSGTRWQAMLLAITTAGYDLETICGEKYLYGKKVLSGEIVDPTFFMRWWEPAKADCDYRDEAVWFEANPSLGKFLHTKDLRALVAKTPEHVVRRYRLNQWTASRDAWLPFGAWDACLEPALDLDPSLPLYVGIDLALRNDSIAVVCAQRQQVGEEHAPEPFKMVQAGGEDGAEEVDGEPAADGGEETGQAATPASPERMVVRAKIWENPWPDNDERHASWHLDVRLVEEHLKDLFGRFPVPAEEVDGDIRPGPSFCYDPSFFQRSPDVLAGEGLTMIEIPQSDARMIPASQGLYQLVVAGKIAHDGDAAFARHVGNANADQKPRGWRLTKPKGSRRKIDAVVACAIAAHRAQSEPPKPRTSVYEKRGIRTL